VGGSREAWPSAICLPLSEGGELKVGSASSGLDGVGAVGAGSEHPTRGLALVGLGEGLAFAELAGALGGFLDGSHEGVSEAAGFEGLDSGARRAAGAHHAVFPLGGVVAARE
jgi:hypothetical protein